MKISIIVAVAENNVIGKDNKLAWHLPADMKYFKEKTTGHCVITGRKNYESIPEKFRPLPNRNNIILTRQINYLAPGAIVTDSMEQALEIAKKIEDSEIFIIGGAEIFKQAIAIANKIYFTKIHHSFEGDTFFPEIDFTLWQEVKREYFEPDEKNKYAYSFFEFVRK